MSQDRYDYLGRCLADSTFNTYASAFNSYHSFCSMSSLPLFPLDENVVELYVCFLARRLAYQSIKVYLSALQFYSITNGYTARIGDMSHLYYVMRGIRIVLGSSRSRPRRLPITTAQMIALFRHIRKHYASFDAKMLCAAVSMAFFGLLRSSEYTSPTLTRCPNPTLTTKDIRIVNNILVIHIRKSKTDPFQSGTFIRIGPNHSEICPVNAFLEYASVRPQVSGPAFVFADGSFLTRNCLSAILSSCFPSVSLNTHSFRIGGASTAASIGIPDSAIQILGRWSSNAYKRYLHFSDDTIVDISERMASSRSSNRIWDSAWLISKATK